MSNPELVNYAVYGTITREVAEVLTGGPVHYARAFIPRFGLRMLHPWQMSYAEREIMQGASRFIAVRDARYRIGIYGGILFGVDPEARAALENFDNSSPDEYEVLTRHVVAIRGLQGEVRTPLPAILVARRKLFGRNQGDRRDSIDYDPYEPFSGSKIRALEVAQEVRETFISSTR